MSNATKINKGMLALTIVLAIALAVVILMPNFRSEAKEQAQPQSLPAAPVVQKATFVPVREPVDPELMEGYGVAWLADNEQYKATIVLTKLQLPFEYAVENGKVYQMMHVAGFYDGDGAIALKVLLGDVKDVDKKPNYDEPWCIDGVLYKDPSINDEVVKCNEFTIDWGLD